jgi:threonine/homoserine/homoserine lactone efflux protein
MSLLSDVLAFAAVAGLVTIIPGLDTAIVLRSAVAHGPRHGFATGLGVATGALCWGAAATAGISALLAASTVAYTALRVAGTVYMVWLGARLLLRAWSDRGDQAPPHPSPANARGISRSWGRGLLTNLLNPKVGAFYVAVLPQFIPAHASHLAVGLLLASIHDVEALVWFTAIILGAHSVRTLLSRRSPRRVIDATTGTALIGFGLKLGLSPR